MRRPFSNSVPEMLEEQQGVQCGWNAVSQEAKGDEGGGLKGRHLEHMQGQGTFCSHQGRDPLGD